MVTAPKIVLVLLVTHNFGKIRHMVKEDGRRLSGGRERGAHTNAVQSVESVCAT